MEEIVVHHLFNGGTEAQIQAANQLAKFSPKQRHKLVEKGIISPLVLMLQSQDYRAIEAALFALLSLAFGSERNKIRIVKSGIVPVLLELLQCEDETLIEIVVAALLILSSCSANKLTITSFGAIPLIVGILGEDGPTCFSMQAKLDALATLHNLSTCQQIIPSVVSSGAVLILLQIIHNSYEKSSRLVEKAMALLENITTLSEDAVLQTATTGGAIQTLVENLEEGSPQCKEHASAILLLICQSCGDEYRGLILREGVMPGLLQLSVDGTWRAKDTARELLLLLRDYSGYGSRGKQSKHQLIEQIMQQIDAEGETVIGTTLKLVEEMIAKLST
ncbi:U-box domain-containing protein 6 [Mercurialis annua]|uniref:U-box domain-containing protein 6 n=1 Tax=Mercurialis annua TaxID=3986 RepID=UPI00215EC8BD|nr:U-box domain-containing protein 6 [Mercurialis annua]